MVKTIKAEKKMCLFLPGEVRTCYKGGLIWKDLWKSGMVGIRKGISENNTDKLCQTALTV